MGTEERMDSSDRSRRMIPAEYFESIKLDLKLRISEIIKRKDVRKDDGNRF